MKTLLTAMSHVQYYPSTPSLKSGALPKTAGAWQIPRSVAILLLLLGLALKVSAAGVWTPLANQAPGGVALMQLLSDGTVMCQNGGSTTWYKLTPDSNGHYVNGTWTTLAPMHDTRTYWASQVLRDGRLFAAGGEYGSGGTNCETYDPLSNTWTEQQQPNQNLVDYPAQTLPNGNVMASGSDRIYDIVANTWSIGPATLHGQDEASWVKLPDGSTLTIDFGATTSERYIPSLNQWIADSTVPTVMYGYGGELGAGFLLPNGKAFYIGATNHTAIYTPSGGTNAGVWTAGADMPYNATEGTTLGAVDSSAAMLFNGKILCALGTVTNFGSATYFFEYDYIANTFTQVGAPTGGNSTAVPPYYTDMLDLPDGTVLFSDGNAQIYSYQPDGSPVANGFPTINNVIVNYDNSYAIFGTLLNGISQGAAYGDDKQMDTGRPIAYVTNSSGSVQFCRTFNWSTCDVATGTNVISTSMTPPSGLPNGTYPLVVAVNGFSSAPYSLTVGGSVTRPPAPTGLTATGGPTVINLAWTQSTGSGIAYNRIYRSINGSGGPYNLLATVPATTSYVDAAVTIGKTYYYEVSAINATAESAPSMSAGAILTVNPITLVNPGFELPGTGKITTGYATVPGWADAGTQYADSGVESGNSHSGSWHAYCDGGDSGGYQIASGYTMQQGDVVTLTWWAKSTAGSAIQTVRLLSAPATNSSFANTATLASLANNALGSSASGYQQYTLTYTATAADVGRYVGAYFVNVAAAGNWGGWDDFNLTYIAGAPQPPPAPTALSAVGGNAVVNLAWTQSSGTGLIGNNVYRSTSGSGGPYNLLANLAVTTSYSDTAVVNGNTYFYTVTAVNGNGESPQSAYAGATPSAGTPPAAPTGLAATAPRHHPGQINLTWTQSNSANITNNKVYRSTTSGGPYTLVTTLSATTSYSDNGLTSGTTYYYVVTAVNSSGLESVDSNQASATSR